MFSTNLILSSALQQLSDDLKQRMSDLYSIQDTAPTYLQKMSLDYFTV